MIIIFSGPDYPTDPQVTYLQEALQRRSLKSVVLNPYQIGKDNIRLLQKDKNISLFQDKKHLIPSAVYISARWRSDSLVSIPANIKYPSVFRSQVGQFLEDFRFAFEDIFWVPGKYEAIERADSKIKVMACAADLGICTPQFTLNSFDANSSLGTSVFRKKLGFPFVVSVNAKKGYEVGVTTTGSQVTLGKMFKSKSPWQWQESLKSVGHVRCCVVGRKVWAVVSDYPIRFSKPKDFRALNEAGGIDFNWNPVQLPKSLIDKLLVLNESLGINLSCPEFLINYKGEEVLIDLNPCGDWFGFFSEETNREIVETLAIQLSPSLS